MTDGLDRCLAEMERRDLDVLLLGRESNARFVTGAARLWLAGTRAFAPTCVVVRSTGRPHLLSITDAGIPADVSVEELYPMTWNPMNLIGSIAAIDGVRGARRIGVDGLTPMFEQLLRGEFPTIELADGEEAMRAARRIKSSTEVDAIRAAIGVAEDSFRAVVDALRPGVRERELVGVFEARMAGLGTSTPAYEGTFCVVDGDGPNRRISSERVIAEGDLVAMSAGALVDGWEGSLARTVPCGAPTSDQLARWSRWRDVWTGLVGEIATGGRVGDLRTSSDGVSVFGIGLGYEGLADDEVLDPGMVLGVELTTAGLLGQDVVLLTAEACVSLTNFTNAAFDA